MHIDYRDYWQISLAILTVIFGAGRLTRVITYDSFPPAVRARILWDRVTRDGEWSLLAHCFWCANYWVVVVCVAWGWLTSLNWTWWAFWGVLALAYVGSIIIARDEPADHDSSE